MTDKTLDEGGADVRAWNHLNNKYTGRWAWMSWGNSRTQHLVTWVSREGGCYHVACNGSDLKPLRYAVFDTDRPKCRRCQR